MLGFFSLFTSLPLLVLVVREALSIGQIGYVGPPCVVADGQLFLHGQFARYLNTDEVQEFFAYQRRLELWRLLEEATSTGVASVPENMTVFARPRTPAFCEGLENADGVEVVLGSDCFIRNGTVFVGGRFRLLNPMERTQFQVLLTNPRTVALEVNSASSSRIPLVEDAVDDGQLPSPATKFMGRFRRATLTTAAEAGDSENGRNSENGGKKGGGPVEVDLVGLLSHFLDVNTTIVERLMPVLEASPLIRQITNAAPEASEGGEEDVKNKGKNNTMGNEQISDKKPSQNELVVKSPLEIGEFSDAEKPQQENGVVDEVLLRQLVKSLASQQRGIDRLPPPPPSSSSPNDEVRRLQHVQGPLRFPPNPPAETGAIGQLKPGDRVLIGGQLYVAVPINQMGGGIPSSQQSSVNPSSNPATTTMNAQQQNPQDTASSATTTNVDQQTQSSSLKLGPFDGVGLMPAAKHAAQAIRQEPPAASRERGWNPAPPAEPAYQKLVAEPASETCHA